MAPSSSGPRIDGGRFIGRDFPTGQTITLERTLADMDRLGFDHALAGSYRAIYHDLIEGNREAAAWAEMSGGRIIPFGIVHTNYYGLSPAELAKFLRHDLGMGSAAIFGTPSYYPVVWGSPWVRAFGVAAAAVGLSLHVGIHDDEELGAIGRVFGDLPTPVFVHWMAGHRYKVMAAECAAADMWPNLRFDVGNASSVGAIRLLAEKIGAHRLFVATNAPHMISDAPVAVLEEAQLAPEDRALIEGGTLAKEGLVPSALPTARRDPAPRLADERAWNALAAQPKVDIHWHPDHWNLGERGLEFERQQDQFTRWNIERVLLSTTRALNHDLAEGNRLAAQLTDKDARIYAFMAVDVLEQAQSLAEIARYANHPRFVGVGELIQDPHGLDLDAPEYEPILEAARKAKLPVLAHLPGLASAADRFPEITFIAAHTNWGRLGRLAGLTNVHFDFSMGHALSHETQLARFVRAVGPERVLFGSDGMLISPAWSLAKLHKAGLPAADVSQILRDNAYRLFPKLSGDT